MDVESIVRLLKEGNLIREFVKRMLEDEDFLKALYEFLPIAANRLIRLSPIGVVRHELSDDEVRKAKWGVRGRIVVFDEYRDGLRGLEGFSHVIIISLLHKASVRPVLRVKPRGFLKFGLKEDELPEIGVFASASPNRPNPIGVTIVELLEVRESELIVDGLDLYDGTPVLDIKPYTIDKYVDLHRLKFPNWYVELLKRAGLWKGI